MKNTTGPAAPPVFKLRVAAEYLGVGLTSVYKLIAQGDLETVKILGGTAAVTRRSCDALIEKSTRPMPPAPLPPAGKRGRGRPRKYPERDRPAA